MFSLRDKNTLICLNQETQEIKQSTNINIFTAINKILREFLYNTKLGINSFNNLHVKFKNLMKSKYNKDVDNSTVDERLDVINTLCSMEMSVIENVPLVGDLNYIDVSKLYSLSTKTTGYNNLELYKKIILDCLLIDQHNKVFNKDFEDITIFNFKRILAEITTGQSIYDEITNPNKTLIPTLTDKHEFKNLNILNLILQKTKNTKVYDDVKIKDFYKSEMGGSTLDKLYIDIYNEYSKTTTENTSETQNTNETPKSNGSRANLGFRVQGKKTKLFGNSVDLSSVTASTSSQSDDSESNNENILTPHIALYRIHYYLLKFIANTWLIFNLHIMKDRVEKLSNDNTELYNSVAGYLNEQYFEEYLLQIFKDSMINVNSEIKYKDNRLVFLSLISIYEILGMHPVFNFLTMDSHNRFIMEEKRFDYKTGEFSPGLDSISQVFLVVAGMFTGLLFSK